MKPVVARFVIVAVVFVGCMTYQAYLALTVSDPVILSRPQFLSADGAVLADLAEMPTDSLVVTVREAHPNSAKRKLSSDLPKPDERITILYVKSAHGWRGPGTYLIPIELIRPEDKLYALPGVPYATEPRIYRATPDATAQLRALYPQ